MADCAGVLIRRETRADITAIADVTTAAFAQPDHPGESPQETWLVDALRSSAAWLPSLSLVATEPATEPSATPSTDPSTGPSTASSTASSSEPLSTVIGHVLATRGHAGSAPVLALGPLSVHPSRQRQGVGSALMHAILGAADALDEPLVALLGAPGFYRRFGFRLGTEYDIHPPVPEWRPYFQVRPLSTYHPAQQQGTFAYAEPFDHV